MLAIEGTNPRLADVIRTHQYLEGRRQFRLKLIHLIAIAGGLLWLAVIIPWFLPRSVLALTEIALPLLFVALVHELVLEIRARLRMTRLLKGEGSSESTSFDSRR